MDNAVALAQTYLRLTACLFVVMIGLGITMPMLPFYVERLALAEVGNLVPGDLVLRISSTSLQAARALRQITSLPVVAGVSCNDLI